MKNKTYLLLPDEEILYRAQQHWIIFIKPVLWTVLSLYFLRYDSLLMLLGAVFAIIGVYAWLRALWRFLFTDYALTNRRFCVRMGLLKRQWQEFFLHRLDGLQVEQGLLGRFLGFGKLTLAAMGGRELPLIFIDKPLQLHQHLQQQIDTMRE